MLWFITKDKTIHFCVYINPNEKFEFINEKNQKIIPLRHDNDYSTDEGEFHNA